MAFKASCALLALSIAVAGCSGGGEGSGNGGSAGDGSTATATPSEAKLASLVAGNRQLERVNRMIEGAGLGDLLNGVGPYTLFAPTNDAVESLGDGRAEALASEGMRPQAVALLRAHMVPGTVTRRDLEASLGSSGDRPVRMQTMADTMLTFTREGGTILISTDDGARARITGDEGVAANGAVQPIDGVLRRTR